MKNEIRINDEKYWKIFHNVSDNWDSLVKQSIKTKVSMADIISNKYKTSYAVGADIAGSIALSKAIG